MFFKHWKLCDQNLIPLEFDKDFLYYVHAKAWHLKGYLGGTHSYITFWSKQHSEWLVVEMTDPETVSYQNCQTHYSGVVTDDITEHAPMITNRLPNARWFGNNPLIVGKCSIGHLSYKDIEQACKEYPLKRFDILTQNCNTFTSYLIWKLRLELDRPFRSVGFKNRMWWSTHIL
jgi:hypothetical protein